MNKAQLFLKAHSPSILTIVGSIGVVSTAILAIKGTPKAMKLIEEAKKTKDEDLTILETIEVAWKPYIPAAISCISTIFCIAGANYLNIKKQKNLMSAYILLDNAFKEYRNRIVNEYGEEVDKQFNDDIIHKQLENIDNDIYAETLFFEFNSMRFFEANIHKVLEAECKAKMQFEQCGLLALNDYYAYLGITPSPYGEALGWSKFQMQTEEHTDQLEFEYERVIMSNGLVCYNIITNVTPTMDLFCF
jgi:hypothetical protein